MKITNKANLPQPLIDAVINDEYDKGHANYSVSDLTAPPRQVLLKKRHIWKDSHEIDISLMFPNLLGKAFHLLMEKHSEPGSITETRMYMTVRIGNDEIIISGKCDRYKDGKIEDWKLTTVWTVIYDRRHSEWDSQQNFYAEILRNNDLPVTGLKIVAGFRDWQRAKADPESYQFDSRYPDAQVKSYALDISPSDRIREEILKRVRVLWENEKIPDDQLPPCTKEEMWETDTVFAVMKKGQKKAFNARSNTREEAEKVIAEEKAYLAKKLKRVEMTIQERPGERKRCAKYCEAKAYCNIWKDWSAKNNPKDNEE